MNYFVKVEIELKKIFLKKEEEKSKRNERKVGMNYSYQRPMHCELFMKDPVSKDFIQGKIGKQLKFTSPRQKYLHPK